jgi:flavin-binding protein dodecin
MMAGVGSAGEPSLSFPSGGQGNGPGAKRREYMPESVYKVIELVGTSKVSWEEAVKQAVATASKSLRDLRIAEVTKLDVKIENGKVAAYRARVSLSFKYEGEK